MHRGKVVVPPPSGDWDSTNATNPGGNPAPATNTVAVNGSLTVDQPTASVASADVGERVNLSVLAHGGRPPYVYNWSGLPSSACSGNRTAAVTCTWASSEIAVINVSVTDSLGNISNRSSSLYFTVYGLPVVADPTANRTSADVGQTVTLSTSALGGDGSYQFLWQGLPANCASAGNPIDCLINAPGALHVTVAVVDSNGGRSAPSRNLAIEAYLDPSVKVTLVEPALDQGELLHLTAVGSNGTGNLGFNWSGLPPGCPNGGAHVTCSTSSSPVRAYSIAATVTDSNGGRNVSAAVTLAVVSDLWMDYPTYSSPADSGQPIGFSVGATGGVAPISYEWKFGDGAGASGPVPSHTYAAPGRYTVQVWVNDSAGASDERSVIIPVASAGGSASGAPVDELLLPLGAAAVVVGVAVAILWRRRRRPGQGSGHGVSSSGS